MKTVTAPNVVIFSILLAGSVILNSSATEITDQLIAHYPFNGNADDESGNGHDGTVNGATLTADRFGNPDSAYVFNGTSSYIEISDNEVLRLAQTDFSISSWCKNTTPGLSHNSVLVKRGLGYNNGWFHSLEPVDPSSVRPFYIVSAGYNPTARAPVSVATNTWVHTVVTYELASHKLSFFMDGELESEHMNIPPPNAATSANLFIGRDSVADQYWFSGVIDDIRIYDRALSPSEILKLYTREIPFAGFYPSTTHIDFGDENKADHLFFAGSFLLGELSDGIDLIEEEVTIQAGPLTMEVPSGSFRAIGTGFIWNGNIDDARVKVRLQKLNKGLYSFSIQAHGVDLTGWTNPDDWSLKIGNDSGTATKWLKGHLHNDRE